MGTIDLDLNLGEEARMMREMTHRFAMEVMRPAGIQLDRLDNQTAVINKDSVLWDVFRKYRELDLHKGRIPRELGGLRGLIDPRAAPLIGQELGYGDAGLTMSLGAAGFPFAIAALSPEKDLQQIVRDFCEDTEAEMIGCLAVSEPNHGSDWILTADSKYKGPIIMPQVKAVLSGNEYILNGQKSSWVTNGSIATHACVAVCLDPTRGMQGIGIAFVPLDRPGVSRGNPLEKIGFRAQNQAEIFFDEVGIPKRYMIIKDFEAALEKFRTTHAQAASGIAMIYVGMAQAALDETLRYARERIQGGVPIIEHKNIKQQLFEMFFKVESARSYGYALSRYHTRIRPRFSTLHSNVAKVLCSNHCYEVIHTAVSVFGACGLVKDTFVEKLFRDIQMGLIADGENNFLSVHGADELLLTH